MKMVHRLLVVLLLTSFGLPKMRAAAPDDLLASYHFIGAATLAGNVNATNLQQILALPDSIKFRDDVLQKLSRTAVKLLGADSKNASQSALLRPLFDDLMASESMAEFRGTKASPIFLLAARLTDERSRLWETNLQKIGGKPKPIKIEGNSGWETKAGANLLKFLRAEKWTVIIVGAESTAAASDFLKQLHKTSGVASDKTWLETEIDWPRLKGFLPLEKFPLKLARTQVQISGKDKNLRTVARIIYPEKIDWKAEPWRIPKDLVRDPLISFSAMQRIAPYFQRPIFPAQIASNPMTNQIFFWGQSQMPFQFYFAMPVKDATNTMKTVGPQFAAAFNDDLQKRDAGKLNMATNHINLVWQGLPIIAPFMQPGKEKSGAEYLLGGLFPVTPSTNLAPAELFDQVSNHKDLVYYDWEITQQRLSQWTMVGQLLPLFPKEPIVSTNAVLRNRLVPAKMPELKWIAAVAPKLGNTITEVTYKSPTELEVVRKSPIGLNSIELILLSHWLAHPNFPFVNPFAAAPVSGQHSTPSPQIPAPKR